VVSIGRRVTVLSAATVPSAHAIRQVKDPMTQTPNVSTPWSGRTLPERASAPRFHMFLRHTQVDASLRGKITMLQRSASGSAQRLRRLRL